MVKMLPFVILVVHASSSSLHYGTPDSDFYAVLGVQREAPQRMIKRGYRKMALILHPDKNQCDDEAANKFVLLRKAFDVLGNRMKRLEYNLENPQAGKSRKHFDWKLPELCHPDLFSKQHKDNWYMKDLEELPNVLFAEIQNYLQDRFSMQYLLESYLRVVIHFKPILLSTMSWNWDFIYIGGILFSSASSLSTHKIYHFVVTVILGFVFGPLMLLVYSIAIVLHKMCVHTFIAVCMLGYALQTELLQQTYTSVSNKYPVIMFAIFYKYNVLLVCYAILIIILATYIQYRFRTYSVKFYVSCTDVMTRIIGIYVICLSVNTQNEAVIMILSVLFCHFCLIWCVKTAFKMPKAFIISVYSLVSRLFSTLFWTIV